MAGLAPAIQFSSKSGSYSWMAAAQGGHDNKGISANVSTP
jgi:hypothetical protein